MRVVGAGGAELEVLRRIQRVGQPRGDASADVLQTGDSLLDLFQTPQQPVREVAPRHTVTLASFYSLSSEKKPFCLSEARS